MGQVARDFMQTDILTVGSGENLMDVYTVFTEKEISGAPVVDEDGNIVGVVSIRDLLRTVEEESESARDESYFFRDYTDSPRPDWVSDLEDFQDHLARRTVSEVMTQNIIAVGPSTSVSEISKTVRSNHIHRVLVIEDEELVGLVSLFDLVKLLE